MANNPIQNNPGVTPPSKIEPYGPGQPSVGAGDQNSQKQFSLSPDGGSKGPTSTQADRPSPMDAARQAAQTQERMTPEALGQQISGLRDNFSQIQNQLQDSSVTSRLTDAHYDALQKVADKMSPDMKNIANNSGGQFVSPEKSGGPVGYLTNWLNGSQQTLNGALNYLSSSDNQPSISSFMKLQYSVQRASQRATLFASVIGSTVSGIKTIMSTQLG